MTAFSMTITNRLNLFGVAPSDKWNAYNWNAFIWGEGTADLETRVGKLIGNTVTPDTTVSKQARHRVSETVVMTEDMGSEGLKDSAGYSYVFPDRTTEAEDRVFPTWTSGAVTSATWTTAAAASTTWS